MRNFPCCGFLNVCVVFFKFIYLFIFIFYFFFIARSYCRLESNRPSKATAGGIQRGGWG